MIVMHPISKEDRRKMIDIDFNGNSLFISNNVFGIDLGVWKGDERLNGLFIPFGYVRKVAEYMHELAEQYDVDDENDH